MVSTKYNKLIENTKKIHKIRRIVQNNVCTHRSFIILKNGKISWSLNHSALSSDYTNSSVKLQTNKILFILSPKLIRL